MTITLNQPTLHPIIPKNPVELLSFRFLPFILVSFVFFFLFLYLLFLFFFFSFFFFFFFFFFSFSSFPFLANRWAKRFFSFETWIYHSGNITHPSTPHISISSSTSPHLISPTSTLSLNRTYSTYLLPTSYYLPLDPFIPIHILYHTSWAEKRSDKRRDAMRIRHK